MLPRGGSLAPQPPRGVLRRPADGRGGRRGRRGSEGYPRVVRDAAPRRVNVAVHGCREEDGGGKAGRRAGSLPRRCPPPQH
jgi:hypothetical protein